MKIITKVLALCLALIMATLSVTSCDTPETPESVLAAADLALILNPYQVNITMDYSSDDEEMNSTLAAIDDIEMVACVDGTDIVISMQMVFSGISLDASYTIVERVVYYKAVLSFGYLKQTIKQKADITDDQYKQFLSDNNLKSSVGVSDFETVEMIKTDDGYIFECADITEKAKENILKLMEDQLSGLDAEMSVDNVNLVAEIKDKKYDTMTVTCDYVITTAEGSYTISSTIVMNYDYDVEFTIEVPADASIYQKVDFDELGI